MIDEEQKRKIGIVIYRLNLINSKINSLNDEISNLENSINKNVVINDKTYELEKTVKTSNNLKGAYNSIKYSIIPSLYRKYYN